MSSLFDAMQQGLQVVENHVGSGESVDGDVLHILGALAGCVSDIHDIDHKMQGAINSHPAAFASFHQLIGALRLLDRAEKKEDNDDV